MLLILFKSEKENFNHIRFFISVWCSSYSFKSCYARPL